MALSVGVQPTVRSDQANSGVIFTLDTESGFREVVTVSGAYDLGDRDSGTVAHLFDERDAAVRWLIARAIAAARRLGKPIGICWQAASDYPDFAEWLVSEGIDAGARRETGCNGRSR